MRAWMMLGNAATFPGLQRTSCHRHSACFGERVQNFMYIDFLMMPKPINSLSILKHRRAILDSTVDDIKEREPLPPAAHAHRKMSCTGCCYNSVGQFCTVHVQAVVVQS